MLFNNISELVNPIKDLVIQTGDFIREEAGKVSQQQIETKSLNSLVSYVDKEAEKKLVAVLSKILPESVFLTEEETIETQSGEYRWIIDPLDGTTNFLHQLPCYAVSVALQHQEKTVLGFVYEPNRRECFHAVLDGGAFINNKPIQVSKTEKLSDALVATGFPYFDFERTEDYIKVFTHFMQNTRGIRRWGAAAVDLAFVAAGRFDGFFEYNLNAWDVAAGALIVQEAGGIVTDFSGSEDFIFGREMICGSPKVFVEMLPILKKYLA